VRGKTNRRKPPQGWPNPIDAHVGARVHPRRTLLGLFQEKLGNALGLTFQKVQKCDAGSIGWVRAAFTACLRFSTSQLAFFTKISLPPSIMGCRQLALEESANANYDTGPMSDHKTMGLVKYYYWNLYIDFGLSVSRKIPEKA
jgi:hypothetical protein